jgi:predicted porin
MKMNKNHRRAAQLVVLVLLLAGLAFAQTPAPATAGGTADLLEVLRAKGILTQQEYDALKMRVMAPTVAAEEAAPMPAEIKHTPFITMMDSGVGMRIGEVDLKFSGELNAFYTHDRPNRNGDVAAGGLVSNSGVGGELGVVPNSSVRSGLLPSDFNITVSTRQKGFDILVDFGFYPGINSVAQGGPGFYVNNGQPTAFATSGIDMRQQYASVGHKHFGTLKFGRDIGLFGQEAILNDFTILAVGTPNGNVAPGSVSLGRIGLGYIYTDFQPQITYSTPSMSGVTASFGVFQPLSPIGGGLSGHGQPAFQAKLAYAMPGKGPVKASFWLNGLTQSLQNGGSPAEIAAYPNIAVGQGIRETAVDGGAKVTVHDFSFVAYGYNGRGIGTEAQLLLGMDAVGHPRMSRGGYLQGTYTFDKKWTFGGSWGISHLSLTPNDILAGNSNYLRSNWSDVAQIRYAMTKWVTPIAEYTHTVSTAHDTGHLFGTPRATEDSIALGAIVFF